MFALTMNTVQYSPKDTEQIVAAQRKFLEVSEKQSNPPLDKRDVRFLVTANEDSFVIANASINYLNSRQWKGTGGVWLKEGVTLSTGVLVNIAALWWVGKGED